MFEINRLEKKRDSFNRGKCLLGKPCHYFAIITVWGRRWEKKKKNTNKQIINVQRYLHICLCSMQSEPTNNIWISVENCPTQETCIIYLVSCFISRSSWYGNKHFMCFYETNFSLLLHSLVKWYILDLNLCIIIFLFTINFVTRFNFLILNQISTHLHFIIFHIFLKIILHDISNRS